MHLFFSQPTSPMARGHVSAILDPGDPHWSPQTIWREYYCSLPSWKAAKENGLILGVNIVVWGHRWRSPGSQMADTWPLATGEVGWEKKRCIWQFQESITGCYQKTKNSFFSKKSPLAKTTFLKTGSAKRAKYCVFLAWNHLSYIYC